MSQHPPPVERVTITVDGVRYRIERSPGVDRETVVERFPGLGLIGSIRPWRGSHYGAPKWWASVNPTMRPGGASVTTGDTYLPSRRAARRWLIEHAPSSAQDGPAASGGAQ